MHVLDANEIFWVTFYTYDKIMELWWKNWPDAFALYTKLVKQSRIQQTDQTKSLNAFLREWLWWGDERLKKAKQVLKTLWLIDDVVVRDGLGKIVWHYVRVNFLINEGMVRNACMTYNLSTKAPSHDLDLSRCGQTDTNALNTQYINALNTQYKNDCQENEKKTVTSVIRTDENKEKFEAFWKIYPHYQSRSRKKDTKTHFLETDYNELMFNTKMLKWKTIIHPEEVKFVPWSQKRVNNFVPMTDYQKKQAIRELYRRHMTVWGDMRTRMEEIVRDFPDVDFSEFREELSKEKTEYAIWHLIHWK